MPIIKLKESCFIKFPKPILAAALIISTGGMYAQQASAHHVAVLGNGLPHVTGKVEKLLLNAYDNCPKNEFEGSNRNSIALLADFESRPADGTEFVNIGTRKNDILLLVNSGYPDFTVVDGNACNDDGAAFTLPDDALFGEYDGDSGEWAVFIRMRGEPGTGIDMALCYTTEDSDGNLIVCDTGDKVDVTRGGGKPKVEDVTRELLGFDQDPKGPKNGEEANPWWDVITSGKAKATLYFYDCDDLRPLGIGEAC